MMDLRDRMRKKTAGAPNMIAEGFPDIMEVENELRVEEVGRVTEIASGERDHKQTASGSK